MQGLKVQVTQNSDFLLPDLKGMSGYFARVLLAPDPLVEAYRDQGRSFKGFAKAFLIPESVASIRWQDPLFPSELSWEEILGMTFSYS
jgi:hypothetical protein